MAVSGATSVSGATPDSDRHVSAAGGRWPRGRNRTLLAGAVLCALWGLVGMLAPLLAPHDPLRTNPAVTAQAPSAQHLLGTDKYGRDVLSRVIHGTRLALVICTLSVLLAAALGLPIGAVAGYVGGAVDTVLMRVVDVLLAFPSFLLGLVLVAVMGPSVTSLVLAIGIRFAPSYARLVRAEILSEKAKDYCVAARALGGSGGRLLVRHLAPNSLAPVITQATMNLPIALLTAAGLSFIGAGVQPPLPEWGVMISEGSAYVVSGAWWMSFFPGLALLLLTVGFVMVGDGLGAFWERTSV
jgi:peptide/nickel transport system permease protein